MKLLTAIGKLKPSSWEEKTNKPLIYLLEAMESIEPEELEPRNWDELDCQITVNNFGNQQYTTIGLYEGDYYALLIQDTED